MHRTDYAVATSQYVHLSVHLSVTCRYSVETVTHIFVLSSPSGSHTILVFLYQTEWKYFIGDTLTGALNVGGMKKIANFNQYLTLSRK